MIRKTMLMAVLSCMTVVSHQINAGPSEAEISDYLKSNPNDLSGLQHTHSHKGYQQFDFNTVVDIDKLKKTKGKLYSSKEDVMKVLMGGVKNPTGEKELWKEGVQLMVEWHKQNQSWLKDIKME